MSEQIEFNFKCTPTTSETGIANFDFPEKDCAEIQFSVDYATGELCSSNFATLIGESHGFTGENLYSEISSNSQLNLLDFVGETLESGLSGNPQLYPNPVQVGETQNIYTIAVAPHVELVVDFCGNYGHLENPVLTTTLLTNSFTGESCNSDLTISPSFALWDCLTDSHTLLNYPNELNLDPTDNVIQRIPYDPRMRMLNEYSISFYVYLDPSLTLDTHTILDRSGIYYQRWSSYSINFNGRSFGFSIGSGTSAYNGVGVTSLVTHELCKWYFIELRKANHNVGLYVDGILEHQIYGVYDDENTVSDLILGSLESGLFKFKGKIKNLSFRDISSPVNCGINSFDGEKLDSTLVMPVFLSPNNILSGENAISDLQQSVLINPQYNIGESLLSVDLSTFVSKSLISELFVGENFDTSIQSDIRVYSLALTGESVQSNLQTSTLFDVTFKPNTRLTTDLISVLPIRISNNDFYSGENSALDLQIESFLSPLDFSGSEQYDVDLQTRPSFALDLFPIKTDESNTVNIVNNSLIRATFAVNAVKITFSLEFPKAFGLSTSQYYDGQFSTAALKLGFTNLQKINNYTGESGYLFQLDTEPNIIVHTGAQLESVLSTTVTLNPRSYYNDGNLSRTSLDTTKYTILDVTEIKDIVIAEWYVEIIKVTCNPRAYTGERLTVDFYSTLDFSLSSKCCLQTTLNALHADIDYYPLPYDLRFDNRTITGLDLNLMCRHFLKSDIKSGETMSVSLNPDGVILTPLRILEGQTFRGLDNTTQFDIGLCRGQFKTVGFNLVAELTDFGENNCTPAYLFVQGETLECELFTSVRFEIDYSMDSRLYRYDLYVDYPMVITILTGERYRTNFEVTFQPTFYCGEAFNSKFYVPPYRAYTGESCQVEIISALAVRFLEEGCLPNDFTSVSSDGQAVAGRFAPVPVEGEPYYHWIKSECYSPRADEIPTLETT